MAETLTSTSESAVQVVQGEDKKLIIKLRDRNDDPIDLTPFSDIQFCIARADETTLVLSTLTTGVSIVGNALLGKIQIDISDTETVNLEPGPLGFEISLITGGTDKNIIQFKDVLEVLESIC